MSDALSLDPRRHLVRPDLADGALRGRVKAAAYVEPWEMEVRAGLAPMRSAPGAAGLVAQLRMGDRVRAAELRDGHVWLQRLRDGYVGWAPEGALGAPGPAATHRVVAPLTHVYPAPDIKTAPRDALPMGAQVSGAPEGRFLRIAAGWVPLAALGAPVGDWVTAAEALIGAPYLWGGESAMGIDCSGLVQLALDGAGMAAPRDSDMQAGELGAPLPNPWAAGDPAALAPDLRRGDLVFWRGHVGVMRDAGTLLHANAHHMAVTSEPLAGAVLRIHAAGAPGAGAGLPTVLRRL
jgi:cell wall-associated NlpC family hydrolase